MHAVDGVLHFGVIALAVNFHPLAKIAAANEREHAVAFADGQQDFVEHLVDALDDLAIIALVLACVGARRELPVRRSLDQAAGLGTSALMLSMQLFRLFLISLKSPL